MTKYEIAQKIRGLLDLDFEDFIDATLALAEEVKNDEENYMYKGECENGEWVEGYVLPTKDGEYRIVTNDLHANGRLILVCGCKVDPDTIEAVEL